MCIYTFKYQPVEELQNERTAGEKHSVALSTKYLKPRIKSTLPFSCIVWQEDFFFSCCLYVMLEAGRSPVLPYCLLCAEWSTGKLYLSPRPPHSQQNVPYHPSPRWAPGSSIFLPRILSQLRSRNPKYSFFCTHHKAYIAP